MKEKRKKPRSKKSARPPRKKRDFVIVNNKAYGNALKGTKIYFEDKKPKALSKDGRIQFGKHILELLGRKFEGERFRWIITPSRDSITLERGIHRIRTSQVTLKRMNSASWERGRDLKLDIVASTFATVYPSYFKAGDRPSYVPGTLSRLLGKRLLTQLSAEDRDAIIGFIPDFIASESLNAISLLKAEAQVKTLKEFSASLKEALDAAHSESWWQNYIKRNILIIQQGYIAAVEKMNVTVGGTKFPDFALVTHDGYLDIMEIKKPNTSLVSHDVGRGNYYWSSEIAKAIIQTENYIENVQHNADAVRNFIRDEHKIDLKVVRPRGIILAGDARKLSSGKQKDDFRLLSQATKNVTFVTYDELLARLENYIRLLSEHSKKAKGLANQ